MLALNQSLVEITENKDIVFDIAYATKNNVFGVAVYKASKVYLHKDAANKLLMASKLVSKLGYVIKIYDAFRPLEVQRFLFSKCNDERYITNPDTGLATHTRGIAIDCSLIDKKTNKELDFGTPFDDFTEKSHQDYEDISLESRKNRVILSGIMATCGFALFMTEWWHFQLSNVEDYPKLTQIEAGVEMAADFIN